jgi:PTS system fructose-specific IIC component
MALATSLLAGPAMQVVLKLKTQRKLHELLSDRHIVLDPRALSIHEVLKVLSNRAAELTSVKDGKTIFRAVWKREQTMHTALPNGLAVPHARLDGLKKPHVLIARAPMGIDFHAPDGELSKLICLILTPTDQPDTQIEMLSTIAKAFEENDTRKACLLAKTPTEFRAVLNLTSAGHSPELTPHDDETLGMR